MNSFEKEYYESTAFWADGAIEDPANLARIKATIDIIPKGIKSLVDIGCGNGVFLNTILNSNLSIKLLGIDRSEEALKYVNTPKKIDDILDVNLPDNSFDCVTCLQVLEHIPLSVYNKALSELARLSNKYIIIGVPYKEKIEKNVTTCPHCKTIFNVDLHLRSYNDNDIESLFSKFGYKLTKSLNLVKGAEYTGSNYIRSLINPFIPKKIVNSFRSPICPICGYKNESYTLTNIYPSQSNENRISVLSILKKSLAHIGPKKETDGYWIIALYQKL